MTLPVGPTYGGDRKGAGGVRQPDGGRRRIDGTGEGGSGSLELASPVALGLGEDRGVVDGARETTPQPVVGSSAAAGAHGDGGSLSGHSQRCRAVGVSLRATK